MYVSFLLQSKDDGRVKAEMIQELTANLEAKNRTIHKMERKIKELESTLSVTNEKRYKLQDTIGTMEKELQSTKAHINQMADMQTRYEPGMPPKYNDAKKELEPSQSATSISPQQNNILLNSPLYRQYKNAYDRRRVKLMQEFTQKRNNYKSYMSPSVGRQKKPKPPTIRDNDLIITFPSPISHPETNLYETVANHTTIYTSVSSCELSNHPSGYNSFQTPSRRFSSHSQTHIVRQTNLRNHTYGNQRYLGKPYQPLIMNGFREYQVTNAGAFYWQEPNHEVLLNNCLIRQDIVARSHSHFRNINNLGNN